MLLGQSILTGTVGNPNSYFGPWMPRGANAAVFVAEVFFVSGGGASNLDLIISIEHKNSEDADSAATTAVSFSGINAAGTYSASASGLKELVRYKYQAGIESGQPEWLHLRMNPPIWQPN